MTSTFIWRVHRLPPLSSAMDMAYIQFSYNPISYQRPRNIDFKAPTLQRDFMMSPFYSGLARALVEEIQLRRKVHRPRIATFVSPRGRLVFYKIGVKLGGVRPLVKVVKCAQVRHKVRIFLLDSNDAPPFGSLVSYNRFEQNSSITHEFLFVNSKYDLIIK